LLTWCRIEASADQSQREKLGWVFMGEVLEFENVRVQLHGLLLRALGVPDAMQWRVISPPRQRIFDAELHSAPLLIATRGQVEVRTFEMMSGTTPARLPQLQERIGYLDALLVREHLQRRGKHFDAVRCWVSYADGGRFELTPTSPTLDRLRQVVQRAMREHSLSHISTRELAERWNTLIPPYVTSAL
jgi:hypothetical protein